MNFVGVKLGIILIQHNEKRQYFGLRGYFWRKYRESFWEKEEGGWS
jgi:hypothetical protein